MALSTDSFNRTSSTTTMGSTNGAGTLDPLTWTAQQGTWGIDVNTLAYPVALSSSIGIATVDLANADVDISTKFTTASGAFICFRFSNTSNFWIWGDFGGSVALFKCVAGSTSIVYNPGTPALSAGDTLRVVTTGSSIAVYKGSLLTTVTDSFNSTATKAGFYASSLSARFDDWSASLSAVTTTVTGTQATETDTASSGTLWAVRSGVVQFIPGISTS